MSKRLAALLGLALIASLATAASANASVSANCRVSGTVQTTPPVQIMGGSGTYVLDDQPVLSLCQGTIDGTPDVFQIDVTTTGVYVDTICGTGTWDSVNATATVTTSVTGHSGRIFSLPYHVDFASFVGHLTFVSPASGTGVVHLTPTGPLPPPGCTSGFLAQAAFSVMAP